MSALADAATWATDAGVGPNEVTVQLQVTCTGNPFLCGDLATNPYNSIRVSQLTGMGALEIEQGGQLEFSLDTLVQIPSQPAANAWTLDGTDIVFAASSEIGTPELKNIVFFGESGGPVTVAGLAFGAFGPQPTSGALLAGFKFDVENLISTSFPDQVVPAELVMPTGSFEMFDATTFELRNFEFGSQGVQIIPLSPVGEVTVTTTVDVVLNLSGSRPSAVPLMPTPGLAALIGSLATLGSLTTRRICKTRLAR